MDTITNLTPHQLRQAANLQEKIFGLQQELAHLLGSPGQGITRAHAGQRRLSAEGLANIRAGAQRRWAKFHSQKGAAKASRPGRRKMSAAGRASISQRLKARWAAAKKAGRTSL